MREIKFRAWDGKKMYLPEYSDKEDFHLLPDGTIVETHEHGYERHELTSPRGENWLVMQFTGLKDKNGKEIYEGDIVNYAVKRKICPICSKKEISSELRYSISRFCPECGTKVTNEDFVTTAKVVFDKGGFAYHKEVSEERYQSWPTHAAEMYIEWAEVIGNIYENKELLSDNKNREPVVAI